MTGKPIDEKVVAMEFDNAAFERNIKQTMTSLDKLKSSLDFGKASAGIQKLQGVADRFSMNKMSFGIESVSAKLLALGAVGTATIYNLTNRAVNAGIEMSKALAISPIKAGFDEYELKLQSIQTIMAGSGADIKTVTKYLQDLNTYSDKTIYSFADMTQNIGKFTNAGVSLKTSVKSIQGIANVAAVSGANAEEASRAMYNFAQALSSGSVKLMDWKSIELANMGTKEFKQQLIDSAVAAGTLKKGADGMYKTLKGTPVSATKGFNESLSDQWLTTKALTKTLSRYADENTKIGKKAFAAAQDVKTFTQMVSTVKETIGSGWAQSFELIFGNLDQAKSLWTKLNGTIGDFVNKSADHRNKVLGDWRKLGGQKALFEGIANVFKAIGGVLKPIKDAFQDIFPPATGKSLADMSKAFRDFTEKLKMGAETSANLKRTFKGFFAVLHIGWTIVKNVLGVFGDLIGMAQGGSGGFLSWTASIGDFFVALDKAISSGEGLKNFFDGLSGVLQNIFGFIGRVAGAFFGLFGGSESDAAADGLNKVTDALTPMEKILNSLKNIWTGFVEFLGNLGDKLGTVGEVIGNALSNVWEALGEALSSGNFDNVLRILNTGLFAVIALAVRNFVKNGLKLDIGGGKNGIFASIRGSFEALTGALKSMQTQIRAKTLLTIAAAVGILVVSIVTLSMIDPKKLAASMTAIAVAMAQLLVAMAILEKISKSAGFLKVPMVAGSMILLAGAIAVLTISVKSLSKLSWSELAKGLTGVAVLLGVISAAVIPLSANSAGLTRAGVGLITIGIAIKILASAVKDFAGENLGDTAKGIALVAGALIAIGIAANAMPASIFLLGPGLVALAVGLKVIGMVVKDFAEMSWGDMAKGMVGMAGALLIIAGAVALMPPTMIAQAAGLVVMGVAINIIAKAIQSLGGMSWGEVAKGLVALGGALLIIAAATYAMSGALPGAAAMIIVAGAIAILAPALVALGGMSWGEIGKGLLVLAGAFAVIGIAALVLTPVLPMIALLGAALLLLGAGIALAGVGILAFATAFGILTTVGMAGVAVLTAMIGGIIALIPTALAKFAEGIIAFVATLTAGAPTFFKAFYTLLNTLLDAAIKLIPKLGMLFTRLVQTGLAVIRTLYPDVVATGLGMLEALLRGIRDHLPELIDLAGDIIVEFIEGIGAQATKILDAAAQTLLTFLRGLDEAITTYDDEFIDAGYDIAGHIIAGMAKGIAEGPKRVAQGAWNFGKSVIGSIADGAGVASPSKKTYAIAKWVVIGFANGIRDHSVKITQSFKDLKEKIKSELQKADEDIKKYQDKLAKAKPGSDDAKAASKALAAAKSTKKALLKASEYIKNNLKDEQKELEGLAKRYDSVTKKLEKAQAHLDEMEAKSKEIADQYMNTVDITKNTTLEGYNRTTAKNTADIEAFRKTLQKLRDLGLDDFSYNKLLAEGPEAQNFANQLMAGGKSAVSNFNKVNAGMAAAAKALGDQVASELFDQGINIARGLVKGLKAEQKNIQSQMDEIADKMVKAIKRKLGIKSPSRAFAEVGKFALMGLVKGLERMRTKVVGSSSSIGDDALAAIRSSVSRIQDAVNGEVDTSPVIAPVIDLTKFRKGASAMGSMIDTSSISANVSYAAAASISADQLASQEAAQVAAAAPPALPPLVQNNYSPEPLSTADIYRQSQNLISSAKKALEKAS